MTASAAPGKLAADRRTIVATELGLLLMALIWGLNFAVLKYGTNVLEPIAYNAIRMTVGAVVLLCLAAALAKPPAARDTVKLMLFGVLGHGVYRDRLMKIASRTYAMKYHSMRMLTDRLGMTPRLVRLLDAERGRLKTCDKHSSAKVSKERWFVKSHRHRQRRNCSMALPRPN